jgi:hypothetical protein
MWPTAVLASALVRLATVLTKVRGGEGCGDGSEGDGGGGEGEGGGCEGGEGGEGEGGGGEDGGGSEGGGAEQNETVPETEVRMRVVAKEQAVAPLET